jgi:hypothetical protein
VATTLLLEGDDLEALLARARAEGGPHARIVRAEKLRHGGVLGFFAKEKFEVALEVPDEFRTSAPQEEPMSQPPTAPVVVAPAGDGALDRFTRRLTAAAEDPEVAAREGILGLAQRADAVELAAARPAQPAVPDALDLALRKLLEPEPASALATGASSTTGAPSTAGALATALSTGLSVEQSTTQSPVHPSTDRPEFTALLDQLLAPTRPEAPDAVVPGPRPAQPAPAAPAQPATSSTASSMSASVPPAYREVSLPPATSANTYPDAVRPEPAAAQPVPAQPVPAPFPAARPVERQTLGRTTRHGEGTPNRDRREDPQLAADRSGLRALGVPTAWTRQLRPGDRFTAVLRMLDRMPEVDIDPAIRIVAVVGPASSVLLEAHRTALDLTVETAAGPVPRTVVHVPAAAGAERATALTEARLIGDVVVAIEADALPGGAERAVEALQAIGAGAVLAIVRAGDGLERAQAFLDALGQVDALAVEGTGGSAEPAAVLQLGLPVVRLDGIPVDRYTWSAVLCAQLGAAG